MPKNSGNVFESGQQKVIPAVLIYVKYGGNLLMIYRCSRDQSARDFHSGKWNGLGGKCDLGESPLQAAKRELKEESKLSIPLKRFSALGVLQFPNFKPHKKEDWIVFVYSVEITKSEKNKVKLDSCIEGALHWIPQSKILKLNLWPGDSRFLPFVFKQKPFIGTLWYTAGRLARHRIDALKRNH